MTNLLSGHRSCRSAGFSKLIILENIASSVAMGAARYMNPGIEMIVNKSLLASILLSSLVLCTFPSDAAESLQFDCRHAEKDYVENYVLQVVPVSKKQPNGKMYLDGRDVDQSDEGGHQEVKSIVIAGPTITMFIEARFDPETIEGVSYPAGTVLTQITLNQVTGQLKKVETIHGGILGANLGEGTKTAEEQCSPSQSN